MKGPQRASRGNRVYVTTPRKNQPRGRRWSVPCPDCGAAVGETCVTYSTGADIQGAPATELGVPCDAPHASRQRLVARKFNP